MADMRQVLAVCYLAYKPGGKDLDYFKKVFINYFHGISDTFFDRSITFCYYGKSAP